MSLIPNRSIPSKLSRSMQSIENLNSFSCSIPPSVLANTTSRLNLYLSSALWGPLLPVRTSYVQAPLFPPLKVCRRRRRQVPLDAIREIAKKKDARWASRWVGLFPRSSHCRCHTPAAAAALSMMRQWQRYWRRSDRLQTVKQITMRCCPYRQFDLALYRARLPFGRKILLCFSMRVARACLGGR